MNNNVCAIVILYNPDYIKLKKLFESLREQVSNIVFVDNSPLGEIQDLNEKWIINLNHKCNYICVGKNIGIAAAQNIGIEYANKIYMEYVLLLDQDSVLPKEMVKNLILSFIYLEKEYKKIAVVGPIFVDEKTNEIAKLIQHKGLKILKNEPNLKKIFEFSDYLIASGSLMKLDVLDILGGMKDELFIDWVDIEWGLRAKQQGYLSFAIPSVIMKHSIGDESVKFVDKNINLHSDFRNYFIVRNSLYLALYSKLPMNFRIIQLFKTPLYILFYSYHSKKPFYSLKLLLIAVKDAILKKMGKGYFEEKEV